MDAFGLKTLLIAQLEDTLAYLLPHGKRKGNYYHVGSLSGEAGDSLRICLSGAKRGIWVEGSDGTGGDILDLWAGVRGANARGMLEQVREYLSVPERRVERRTAPKRYQKPSGGVSEAGSVRTAAGAYLASERYISEEIIADFQAGQGKNPNEIAFPYFDEDGELRMVKYVGIERDARGKKKVFTTAESMPILYGMNTMLVSDSMGELVICEGEVDAMSYQSMGIPAVSVPFGAKADGADGHSPNDEWIENCWTFLERFHTIYVSMDMDKEGRAAAGAIIHRLGRERCRAVELPFKDANECLGKADLRECLASAKSRDPDDMVVSSELVDRIWKVIRRGRRELQGIQPFGWDIPFRLRPREGTLWTGYGGHGKSNMLYQMAAWLACTQGQKVFIGSYEEPAEDILAIMAAHAIGRVLDGHEKKLFSQLTEALYSNIIVHDYQGTMNIDSYFEYAEYAIRRYGCQHAILDSVSTTTLDLDDKESVEAFAKRSQRLWKETGAHFHVVAHSRKAMNEEYPPGKADIKGSGFLGDLFFNAMVVHRPKDTQEHDGILCCVKQKVGGFMFRQHLFFDGNSYRFRLNFHEKEKPYINIQPQ